MEKTDSVISSESNQAVFFSAHKDGELWPFMDASLRDTPGNDGKGAPVQRINMSFEH